MAEEFTLKVKLVPEGEDLEEGLEEGIRRTVKRAQKDRRVVDGFSRLFSNAFRETKNFIEGTFIGIGRVVGRVLGLQERRERVVGAFGRVGAVVGGMAGAVAVFGAMFEFIKKGVGILANVSGILGNVLKILNMSFMMALKPIADIVGLMLLPVAVFLLTLFSELYKQFGQVFLKKFIGFIKVIVDWSIKVAKFLSSGVGKLVLLVGGILILKRILGGIAGGIRNLIVGSIRSIRTFLRVGRNVSGVVSRGFGILKNSFVRGVSSLSRGIRWLGSKLYGILTKLFSITRRWVINGLRYLKDLAIKMGRLLLQFARWVAEKTVELAGRIATALAGVFQTGGYVERTGIYRLHRGEYVVNPAEQVLYGLGWRRKEGMHVFINMEFKGVTGKDRYEIADAVRRVLKDMMMRGEISSIAEWNW